jgi:hypothetical protein
MARLREIVIDSIHPAGLARFWAAALDGYRVRPYDEVEIARLAGLGLAPETDPTVLVDGPGPILCFQKVEARKSLRNRIHLDIVGVVRSEEVARLAALGARVRDEHERFTVMLDPEGNEFCVQDPG